MLHASQAAQLQATLASALRPRLAVQNVPASLPDLARTACDQARSCIFLLVHRTTQLCRRLPRVKTDRLLQAPTWKAAVRVDSISALPWRRLTCQVPRKAANAEGSSRSQPQPRLRPCSNSPQCRPAAACGTVTRRSACTECAAGRAFARASAHLLQAGCGWETGQSCTWDTGSMVPSALVAKLLPAHARPRSSAAVACELLSRPSRWHAAGWSSGSLWQGAEAQLQKAHGPAAAGGMPLPPAATQAVSLLAWDLSPRIRRPLPARALSMLCLPCPARRQVSAEALRRGNAARQQSGRRDAAVPGQRCHPRRAPARPRRAEAAAPQEVGLLLLKR